jgi:hypothetical protein
LWLLALLVGLLPCGTVRAEVVINEVFYNAPNELSSLQWLELYNTGSKPADLSGWVLDKGKGFVFPKGAALAAHGYLVLALDPAQFQRVYGAKALGPLLKPLKRGGEKLALADAKGQVVDAIQYKDKAPWPAAADGYSASLERICPTASGEEAGNWAPSPLPSGPAKPSGTPGKQNSCFSAVLPPTIVAVTNAPETPAPGKPVSVEVSLAPNDQVPEVKLAYHVVSAGSEGAATELKMVRDAATGKFEGEIPGQRVGSLVRYNVLALGEGGAQRRYPSANDLRPTLTFYVRDPQQTAKIAIGRLLSTGSGAAASDTAARAPAAGPRMAPGARVVRVVGNQRIIVAQGPRPGQDGNPTLEPFDEDSDAPPGRGPVMLRQGQQPAAEDRPARGSYAFVYWDPTTGKTQVFDYVNAVTRDGNRGYKVYFQKDHLLNQMSSVSLVFEGSERFLMAEALAYDLYHRVGCPAPQSDFVRLYINDRPVGYHLMVERPNKAFLRRNSLNDKGNLYKLRWFGGDLLGQHEKKTNVRTGKDDLVNVVRLLQQTRGDQQWKVIQEHFDVPEVANYFAVNMVLSHWDGFFNNYYAYDDLKGSQKWMVFPWDQDKTWGYYDGIQDNQVFYTMPLTFGSGQAPSGNGGMSFGGGPGFFGDAGAWWRPPGHFSGPLLANPQFRAVFLARVKQILDKVYTKEVYFPAIDQMFARLQDDIRLRGEEMGMGGNTDLASMQRELVRFKTHVVRRRDYLMAQLAPAGNAPRVSKGTAGVLGALVAGLCLCATLAVRAHYRAAHQA